MALISRILPNENQRAALQLSKVRAKIRFGLPDTFASKKSFGQVRDSNLCPSASPAQNSS